MAGGKKRGSAGAIARQGSVFFEEVMAFLLLAVAFFGLIWQGMLFERDNIVAVIILSVLAFIVVLKARLVGEWAIRRPYAVGVFLLLAAASAVSLLNAVYMHNALYVVSKNCSFLLLALAVQALDDKLPFGRWLAGALAIAGAVTAILGLDAVWGGYLVGGINAFLHGGPLADGEQGFLFNMMLGDRLSSVFQYPNTAASFLLAAWFASVHGLLHDETGTQGGGGAKASAGTGRLSGISMARAGGANLILMAFVLTVSRGMYLVSLPMLLLCVFFLPKQRKGQASGLFFLCLIPGLVVGALSLPGAPLRTIHPGLGWLLMAALFGLSAYAAGLLQTRMRRQAGAGAGEAAVSGKASETGKALMSERSGKAFRLTRLRRIGQKPALVGLAALIVCVMLLLLLAWYSSRPFAPGGGASLVRQFQADGAGDYTITLAFERPIDERLAETRLTLSGQNRQEMLRGDGKQYIETDLSGYIGQKGISLPFTLADSGTYLMLGVYGVNGDAGGNAIASISLVSADGRTRQVKLNKYLFSESLIRRIEVVLHPKTMYDRFGFYLDGFRIFRDFPLTGIGGDSWMFIYFAYQKYPYVANDLHSYVMQLFVEFGICGAFTFLGFIAALIALFIRCLRHQQAEDIFLFLVAGTLFAHSMIDVDFTYYGQYILFVMAFSLIRFKKWTRVKERQTNRNENAKAVEKTKNSAIQEKKIVSAIVRYMQDVVVLVALIFACIIPFRMSRADAYADAYLYSISEENPELSEMLINQAVALDPAKPEYQAALALQIARRQILSENELSRAQVLAANARELGRFSKDALQILISYHQQIGQYDKTWEAGRRLTDIEPYNNTFWLSRGRMISDILLQIKGEGQSATQASGLPENANGSDDKPSVAQDADKQEELRYWLEKGLSIAEDMERLSAERWAPIEPDEALVALFDTWREELRNLLPEVAR